MAGKGEELDPVRTSLRAFGRLYRSNGYALTEGLWEEAADLIRGCRAKGWSWAAMGRAASLDPRTLKRMARDAEEAAAPGKGQATSRGPTGRARETERNATSTKARSTQ